VNVSTKVMPKKQRQNNASVSQYLDIVFRHEITFRTILNNKRYASG